MGVHAHSTLADFLGIIPREKKAIDTIENLLRQKWRRNRRGFTDREEERRWGEKTLAQLRHFVNTQIVDVQPLLLEKLKPLLLKTQSLMKE